LKSIVLVPRPRMTTSSILTFSRIPALTIGVEERICGHKRRATIVVHIRQYGFRRWALKSVRRPLEEVTSHHIHTPDALGRICPQSLQPLLPCVYVTTSKLLIPPSLLIVFPVVSSAVFLSVRPSPIAVGFGSSFQLLSRSFSFRHDSREGSRSKREKEGEEAGSTRCCLSDPQGRDEAVA
jgi:hypothetical protein